MTAPMTRPDGAPQGRGGRGGRPDRPSIDLEVIRTEVLTSRMVRVVLGGPGLADYHHNDSTDRYVKIVFPQPAVDGGEPRTVIRTYTVRHFDPDAGELWIDFVQHGDEGIAGPWAANARPGDRLSLRGPGGGYAPDPAAGWHLFVGDPAAFPAIAAALDALPAGAVVRLVLQAHDADEATYLQVPDTDQVQVRWLIDDEPTTLLEAVEQLEFPEGTVDVFVHGELREVRAVRAHLVGERGLAPDGFSLSGYWRQGLDEEGFQQEKRATR